MLQCLAMHPKQTTLLCNLVVMRVGAFRAARLLLRRGASSGQPGPTANHRPAVPAGILTLLKYSLIATAGAGVTIASLPALLSTPLGLQAVLAVLNVSIPGKLHAGRLDVSLPGWNRIQAKFEGCELFEPPTLGGQFLFSAKQVIASGGIWDWPTEITFNGATMNGSYNASAREFRVIRWMQYAGIIEPPPPKGDPPSSGDPRPQDEDSGAVAQGVGGAQEFHSDQSLKSSKDSQSDDTQLGESEQLQEAFKAAVSAAADPPEGQTRQDAAIEAISKTIDIDEDDPARSKLLAAVSAATMSDSEAQEKKEKALASEEKEIEESGAFMRVLCERGDTVPLSGQLRMPGMHMRVQNSEMQVSKEMRSILGGGVELLGAFSVEHLAWLQDYLSKNPNRHAQSFVAHDSNQGSEYNKSQQDSYDRSYPGNPSARDQAPANEARKQQVQNDDLHANRYWWQQEPVSEVPAEKLASVRKEHGDKACEPGEWMVTAPNLKLHLRVWEITAPPKPGSTEPKSFTVLHQPATMSVGFTEALGSFALAAINPLLGRVSSLTEGSKGVMHATMLPDGWVLPYTAASMWIDPMCLKLAASPTLSQLLSGLRAAGFGLGKPAWLRDAAQTSQHDHHHRDHSHVANNRGSDNQRTGVLEAWLSGMHIRLERDGVIQQRRVDMLIGPPGLHSAVQKGGHAAEKAIRAAFHLVLWGKADPETDKLDMVVGLPEALLHRMGARRLPHGYCLPLRLCGTMDAPRLELNGLRSKIIQLVLARAADIAGQRETEAAEQETPLDEQEHFLDAEHARAEQADRAKDESHHHRGIGFLHGVRKVLHTAKKVLNVAMSVIAPTEHKLVALEQDMAHTASSIPKQECRIPWVPA